MNNTLENEKINNYWDENFQKMKEEFEKDVEDNRWKLYLFLESHVYFSLNDGKNIKIYEWYDNGCPYDNSGDINFIGYKNYTDITMKEYLFDCYTGNFIATYISHYGLIWERYCNDFSEYVKDYLDYYYSNIVERYYIEYLKTNYPEKEINYDDMRDELFDIQDYIFELFLENTTLENYWIESNEYLKEEGGEEDCDDYISFSILDKNILNETVYEFISPFINFFNERKKICCFSYSNFLKKNNL